MKASFPQRLWIRQRSSGGEKNTSKTVSISPSRRQSLLKVGSCAAQGHEIKERGDCGTERRKERVPQRCAGRNKERESTSRAQKKKRAERGKDTAPAAGGDSSPLFLVLNVLLRQP